MFEEKYGNLGFAIDISNYMSYSGQIPIRHLKMIAGNPHYSNEYANAGLIHVYDYNSSAHYWDKIKTLLSPNGQADNAFGYSVALENELMVIGAPGQDKNDTTHNNGGVYISLIDGGYAQYFSSPHIMEGSSGHAFGNCVDIADKYVIVGALHHYVSDDEGAAYIYKKADSNYAFNYLTPLMIPEMIGDDAFGSSVAINSHYAVVGARETSDGGRVYIFENNGTDSWEESRYFKSSADINYSYSVSLHKDTLFVGAPSSEKVFVYADENVSLVPAILMYLLN